MSFFQGEYNILIFEDYLRKQLENRLKFNNEIIYFQVHLLTACSEKCEHCYLNGVEKNNLSLTTVKKLINQIDAIAYMYHKTPLIDFTGGDPLLFPNICEIFEYCKERKIPFGLKCNPNLLTDELVNKLKLYGIQYIQFSLDGPKDYHDSIRSQGSYNQTLKRIKLLNKYGIRVSIKFTISKENRFLLIPLLESLLNEKVVIYNFTFARLWNKTLGKQFNESEYLQTFDEVLKWYKNKLYLQSFYVNKSDVYISIGFKDHLWYPYLFKNGMISADLDKQIKKSKFGINCSLYQHHYIIDANGDVLKCRKTKDSKIGNIFSDKLIYIINSQKNKLFINETVYSKCHFCLFYKTCSGCSAFSDNIFSIDNCCIYYEPRYYRYNYSLRNLKKLYNLIENKQNFDIVCTEKHQIIYKHYLYLFPNNEKLLKLQELINSFDEFFNELNDERQVFENLNKYYKIINSCILTTSGEIYSFQKFLFLLRSSKKKTRDFAFNQINFFLKDKRDEIYTIFRKNLSCICSDSVTYFEYLSKNLESKKEVKFYFNSYEEIKFRLEQLQLYYTKLAKYMNQESLSFSDLFYGFEEVEIPINEGRKLILSCIKESFPELLQYYTLVLNDRNIYYLMESDSSYTVNGVDNISPLIFINYKNNLESLYTLMHEASHAVHFLINKDISVDSDEMKMEANSFFFEQLLFRYIIKKLSQNKKEIQYFNIHRILYTLLYEVRNSTFLNQCIVDKKHNLDSLGSIWVKISQQVFGYSIQKTTLFEFNWMGNTQFFVEPHKNAKYFLAMIYALGNIHIFTEDKHKSYLTWLKNDRQYCFTTEKNRTQIKNILNQICLDIVDL